MLRPLKNQATLEAQISLLAKTNVLITPFFRIRIT